MPFLFFLRTFADLHQSFSAQRIAQTALFYIFHSMSHTATMWHTEPASTKKWNTECIYRRLLNE